MKSKHTETKFTSALRMARPLFTSRMFGSVLLGLVLLSGSAWAATSAIEGIVKDPKGQVISGANVRIEASGGSSWSKVVKTDAKGHYVYNGLDVGTYRVSLLVNGSVKASINNVKTKLGDPTKLNFDLKGPTSSQASAPAKRKATHMVYVPSETGSHIGGRWVEVDDNGTADTTGADNVEKVSGNALRKIQGNSSAVLHPNGGSGN
jgi:Carboxypeptidase regulatory-like domain